MSKRKTKKPLFWDDKIMHPLLVSYHSCWEVEKNKPTKLLVPDTVKNALWEKIHPELRKICLASARAISKNLTTNDVIESAMVHMHYITVHNWKPERLKSYSYFYTCARSWFFEYLQGTGRGKLSGQIGKKSIIRKSLMVPISYSKEEAIEEANKGEINEWFWSSWSKRKAGDSKTHKKCSFYRYQDETVSFESHVEDFNEDFTEESDWSWSSIADIIDWQILSEYIPDTSCSDYTKKLAYIMLDAVRMLVENEVRKNVGILLVYQLVRARLPHSVTNHQLLLVRDCLRQAFEFYAEDELYSDL